MRIAIDARELAGKPTGVGRYLGELLRAWSDLPGARSHEFFLCAPEPVRVPDSLNASVLTAAGNGTAWEQLTLPRLVARANADVLFAPGYGGPLGTGVPMVVAVHDVSFAAHPEWFAWREGLRRRIVTRLAARKAARVITISDFSKQEIARHLRIPLSNIEVIYCGATQMTTPARPDPTRPADHLRQGYGGQEAGHYDVNEEPSVLFVGSLFNRRHIPEMIAGFEQLASRHSTVRLDIVGDNRTRPYIDIDGLIAKSHASNRIRARAYVADAELAALYKQARAFVFLSEYEGFALTPLEALGAGVPVVLLDTDVAREVYGAAATYVERPDPTLIAEALERALFDEDERARVLAAAAPQLERYSWPECAQRTLQVLLACARHR